MPRFMRATARSGWSASAFSRCASAGVARRRDALISRIMRAYFIERARRQFAARDLAGALDSCRHAVGGEPSSAEAWFLKATVEMALGQRDEAAASAARAAELAP